VVRAVVWRIARRPYALDRLGAGARQDGGRWNRPGTGVIYAGSTIAIAALEQFVHLAGVVPADLVLVRVTLPAGCSTEAPTRSDLPRDWDLVPAGPGSMDFGTRWAQEKRSLVLYVPSVVLREERNAVLNPAHAEFARVKLTIEREFSYDPRMYSPRRAPSRRTR
jgi:RES domain-containing protein